MSVFNRVTTLRRAIAVAKAELPAEQPDPKDAKPTAGIQVSNTGDPKYGVYEHELGGEKIGHTVNVTGQGWTAVPTEGEIKGKFKKHVEAQQYLADNHVENTKTRKIEEGAVAASQPKKVKKDDEDNQPGDATTATTEVEKAEAIVKAVHQFQQFKAGGGKEPVKPEHQAAFEANQFKAKS